MTERDIFIEALQQPSNEEQSAYLDQACGQDPKLRDRIESLLQQERALDSFLEEPAYELNETSSSTSPAAEIGQIIGSRMENEER